MSENHAQSALTHYSEGGFLGRSIVLGGILGLLTYGLCDASGWQAWVIGGVACVFCLGISIQQATVIENGIMLILIAAVLGGLWSSDYFGFHWSVLLAGFVGALNGMSGREARNRHQFRVAYGDAAYRERYGNQ